MMDVDGRPRACAAAIVVASPKEAVDTGLTVGQTVMSSSTPSVLLRLS